MTLPKNKGVSLSHATGHHCSRLAAVPLFDLHQGSVGLLWIMAPHDPQWDLPSEQVTALAMKNSLPELLVNSPTTTSS